MTQQYEIAVDAKHNEVSKAGGGKSRRYAHSYSGKEAIECEAQGIEIKNLDVSMVAAAGLQLPVVEGEVAKTSTLAPCALPLRPRVAVGDSAAVGTQLDLWDDDDMTVKLKEKRPTAGMYPHGAATAAGGCAVNPSARCALTRRGQTWCLLKLFPRFCPPPVGKRKRKRRYCKCLSPSLLAPYP
ncbi:hypothetical protein CB1_001096004 [Camelus ferus]|nr:hypothetical protein CB1_001096004 [Camelus ferus]